MVTIVTRAGKGSPLTNAELDANFENLNNGKFEERGPLPNNNDHNLDTYMWPSGKGVWYQNANAYATTAQNYPIARAGVLEVFQWQNAAGPTIQRYTSYTSAEGGGSNTPRIFVRSSNAINWYPWLEIYTMGRGSLTAAEISNFTAAATAVVQAFGIGTAGASPGWPGGNLTTNPESVPSGVYSAGATVPGAPVPDTGWILIWAKYSSSTGVLTALRYNTGEMYTKRWNGSVWSAWSEMYIRGAGGLAVSEIDDFADGVSGVLDDYGIGGEGAPWPVASMDTVPSPLPGGGLYQVDSTNNTELPPETATQWNGMWSPNATGGVLVLFPVDDPESKPQFRALNGGSWGPWSSLGGVQDNLEWLSKPIGEPFPLWDHLPSTPIPPTDNEDFRFIKLTAGDAYNTGVLINESVTGTAPLVEATAQITLTGSPYDGATVHLINTERRSQRAGESGVVQQDALQNITGTIYTRYAVVLSADGVFVGPNAGSSATSSAYPNTATGGVTTFDASRVARTDNETRDKNIGATFYMRVK